MGSIYHIDAPALSLLRLMLDVAPPNYLPRDNLQDTFSFTVRLVIGKTKQ